MENLVLPQPGQQKRFLESRADITIYGGAAGGGKLLSLDCPIPTPHGFQAMGDVRVGSTLFDETGKSCRVIRIFDIVKQPELYRLTFDDETHIDCCKDHQWLTYSAAELSALTRRSPEWRARRRAKRPSRASGRRSDLFTEVISKRNTATPPEALPPPAGTVRTTLEIAATLKTNSGRLNHAVPVAGALQLPDSDLPIDPYVLGVWLGDGTASTAGLTSADPEIWQEVERRGFEVRHHKKSTSHRIVGLEGPLRLLGLLDNKYVPSRYLRAGRQQRLDLIRGLMDTDGTVAVNSGSAEFCNTNEHIVDGMIELINSLGWKVVKRRGTAWLYGKDCGPKWTLKWMPSEFVFNLDRKRVRQKLATRRTRKFRYITRAERIAPRPGRCISVDSPSRLYLAGRQMVPTHNSFGMLLEATRHMGVKGWYGAIFRRTTVDIRKPGAIWDQSLELYSSVRGASPSESFLEWDFGGGSGGKLKFGHLEHETTVYEWHGAQLGFLGFDELTTFTAKQFWYLLSRMRSTTGKLPYCCATCNPDPESFVADLISWWIGEDGYPIPERDAKVRYFVRVGDELVWGDSPEDLEPAKIGVPEFDREGKPITLMPMSLTFIHADVYDNPALLRKDPKYLANLLAQPTVDRERLLRGNWKIKPAAGLFFKRHWCEMVNAVPAGTTFIRGWDLAATEKTQLNDPDRTCGTKIGRCPGGKFIVAHHLRMYGSPGKVKAALRNTATQDGPECAISIPQDPGQAGKAQVPDLASALLGFNVRFSPEARMVSQTVTSTTAKVERFKPFSAQAEAGNILVLGGDWNEMWFAALEGFPELRHDDDVDSTARAFNGHIGATTGLSQYYELKATQLVAEKERERKEREPDAPSLDNGGVRVRPPDPRINVLYGLRGETIPLQDGAFLVDPKHYEHLRKSGYTLVQKNGT